MTLPQSRNRLPRQHHIELRRLRLGGDLELGQHPIRKGLNYDEYIGDRARRHIGAEKWNRRVRRAIETLSSLVNYDMLHIGGGNSSHIKFELPENIRLVDNKLGVLGGIALWERCDANGNVKAD